MSPNPGDLSRRSALAGGVLGAAALSLLGVGSMAQAGQLSDRFGPLHHIGVVLAPTFDQAQATLSAALGIEWYAPQIETLPIRDEHGHVHDYTDRFVLSRGGQPHIELLDPVPGTFFDANQTHPVVELGYVVGDQLATLSEALTQAGMPRVGTIAIEPQQGAVGVAWHRLVDNFLIELLADDPVAGL